MQHYQVYLTPISPIHIGCGEDFEPTNYIIDNNVLYHFEPSQLHLSENSRSKLANISQQIDLLAIQKFFLENKEQAVTFAHYFADISEGVAQLYKDRVGKVAQREEGNKTVINQLSIERTAYLSDKNLTYIPASSLKGALATALLNEYHQANNNPKVQKGDHNKLLKSYLGDFSNSQLASVKFGDFMPTNDVQSKVFYAINFKKKLNKERENGRGVLLRRECINGGQFRAFKSELALWQTERNKRKIQDYIQSLNAFYLPIFKQEAQLLVERRLVEATFFKQLESIISQNKVALIRLGKNGADSKIYQGENVAQIKIMLGNKQSTFKDRSTTVWLAAQHQEQKSQLLPFGWALLEFNEAENSALKQWCEQQPKSDFNRQAIIEKRQAKLAEFARQEAERKKQEEARLKAEQEKAANFAALSENKKIVAEFIEKVQQTREIQADNQGSALLKEALALIENAVNNWDLEDRQYAFSQITVELLKSKIRFNKKDTEKNVKKALNKLVAE